MTLFTANVPKAQITGFEADFTVRPSDNFQFGASGNYTNARYTKNALSITLPPDPTNLLRYGPFADTPRFSGTFFAEASADLGNTGRLTLRGDVYSQSKMYFTNVGDTLNALAVLPAYTLVNAKLTLSEIMGTRLSASVSARNLFNRKYYAGGNAANSATLPNTVNPGVPRMIMGELRFDF